MRKLLLTSALIGSTLVAGNAFAQTTVSGNLDIAFKAIEEKGTTPAAGSLQGFGKEAQINIQNKGKLNNGWDYAAGFSLEDDANQTTTLFNENTFIDLIIGGTTLTVGQDHIQNSDRTTANFVGLVAEDLTNSSGSARKNDRFQSSVGADPAQSFGVGIMQKVGNFGTVSAWFVPQNDATVAADDTATEANTESAYEIGFVGSLNVPGLNVHAFINQEDKTAGNTAHSSFIRDRKGENIGVSYTTGQFTAGYDYKKTTPGIASAAASTSAGTGNAVITQNSFGIAYAATPNLTLGANYTVADSDVAGEVDAKSKSIAVGYNLGAVALTAQAAKLTAYSGVTGEDADVLYLRASTKF